jgi:hypothetical protein
LLVGGARLHYKYDKQLRTELSFQQSSDAAGNLLRHRT